MRISDWSSDVCSSDLSSINYRDLMTVKHGAARGVPLPRIPNSDGAGVVTAVGAGVAGIAVGDRVVSCFFQDWRSEEHTSELQSLMRISYAVFCLKKKTITLYLTQYTYTTIQIDLIHYY